MGKKMRTRVLYCVLLLCSYCFGEEIKDTQTALVQSAEEGLRACKKFTLQSNAFSDGRVIPIEYTCDGIDISPFLFLKYASVQTITLDENFKFNNPLISSKTHLPGITAYINSCTVSHSTFFRVIQFKRSINCWN